MKRGYLPNLCNSCPVTSWTTCSLQTMAYERYGWDGMAKCEMRDDVRRMLDAMEDSKRRGAPAKR